MFGKPNHEDLMLEMTQTRLMTEMDEYGPNTPEYASCLAQLEKVATLKTATRRKQIDPNTVALIAANFAAIGLLALIETRHVLPQQAMKFMNALKP